MAKIDRHAETRLRRFIRETVDDAEGGYGSPVGTGLDKVTQQSRQELMLAMLEAMSDDGRVNSLLDNLKAAAVAAVRKSGIKAPAYSELREGDFDIDATNSVLQELARALSEAASEPLG